jgi:hypothetical protein
MLAIASRAAGRTAVRRAARPRVPAAAGLTTVGRVRAGYVRPHKPNREMTMEDIVAIGIGSAFCFSVGAAFVFGWADMEQELRARAVKEFRAFFCEDGKQ